MSEEIVENLLCEIFNLNQVINKTRVDSDLFFIGQSSKSVFEFKFKEVNNTLFLKVDGKWVYKGRLNEHGLYDAR